MLCSTRIEEGKGKGASSRARRGGFARGRRVDARVASRSAAADEGRSVVIDGARWGGGAFSQRPALREVGDPSEAGRGPAGANAAAERAVAGGGR
ncbi:hypothetical protein K523DRAFT_116695 [Schizophyllum commune Tattone D]|nr:hypothetical protein K523DRAFT_116695 [Schizophyllum commune Tattone D]